MGLNDVGFSPNGTHIVVASDDAPTDYIVSVWNLSSLEAGEYIYGHDVR